MSASLHCPVCNQWFATITGDKEIVYNRLANHLVVSHDILECPCGAREPINTDFFVRHLIHVQEMEDLGVHFMYHTMGNRRCPVCNKEKDDVMERPDEYAQEMGDANATMISCAACAQNNTDDI